MDSKKTEKQTPADFLVIALDEIIRQIKRMKRKKDSELRKELIELDILAERAVGVLQIYRTLEEDC